MGHFKSILLDKPIILIVMACLFTSCNKDITQLDEAQLLGVDYRKCALPYCGGYWIEIKNDTFRFFEIPINSDVQNLNTNTDFPIGVNIVWDWPNDSISLKSKEVIVITELKKAN